jgi:quercetin dioxygenase-like cupin family protein
MMRGATSMRSVFSVNSIPWQNLRGLPGARGFEYKALSESDYSSAFNAELVRLEPGDHSVPHIEPWSHLLYLLSGTGDVTIDGETQPVATGTVCQIKAGQKHSLRNLGEEDMIVLTIYDPPRKRVD